MSSDWYAVLSSSPAFPMSGRRVPEYPEADLREVLERPFRIIYRLTTEQVEIVTIMHYRQLLPTDLKEFDKR